MHESLSLWFQESLGIAVPVGKLVLIAVGAWLLRRLGRLLIRRLSTRSLVPSDVVAGLQRAASFLITTVTILLMLQQLGVSTTVMWTAFTGFAAVAAVAFFAAWSVLSNIFCTVLIVTTRPFRLHDHIEVLEGGDKPGLRGEVIDVNLVYTTLRETTPEGGVESVLQVPNNLFFQRTVRRWRNPGSPPLGLS